MQATANAVLASDPCRNQHGGHRPLLRPPTRRPSPRPASRSSRPRRGGSSGHSHPGPRRHAIAQAAGSNGSVSSGCATPAQASNPPECGRRPGRGISEPLPYQSSGSYVLIQISSRTPGTIRVRQSIIRRLLLQSARPRRSGTGAGRPPRRRLGEPPLRHLDPEGLGEHHPTLVAALDALLSGTADKPRLPRGLSRCDGGASGASCRAGRRP